MWFLEYSGNRVARLVPGTGAITEVPVPTSGSNPLGMTAGPDGNLWFTEVTGNKIGRLVR
jgi:virginiamycin B lyase